MTRLRVVVLGLELEEQLEDKFVFQKSKEEEIERSLIGS